MILAGLIGVKAQAIYIVTINISELVCKVPIGFAEGICVVVGNAIGANDVNLAKKWVKLTIIFVTVVLTLGTLICLIVKKSLIGIFTNDPDIGETIITLMPIVGLKWFFNGMQYYVQGVIRALALQQYALYLNLMVIIFVQLPTAYLFAFKFEWGVAGLLWADSLGMFVQLILFL